MSDLKKNEKWNHFSKIVTLTKRKNKMLYPNAAKKITDRQLPYFLFAKIFEKFVNTVSGDMQKNEFSNETATEIWKIGLEAYRMFGNSKGKKYLVCDGFGYHWENRTDGLGYQWEDRR